MTDGDRRVSELKLLPAKIAKSIEAYRYRSFNGGYEFNAFRNRYLADEEPWKLVKTMKFAQKQL